MSTKTLLSNQNETLITHRSFLQNPVHFFIFVFTTKPMYEVWLVRIKEQVGDNPLDILSPVPSDVTPYPNEDSFRLLWSNGLS